MRARESIAKFSVRRFEVEFAASRLLAEMSRNIAMALVAPRAPYSAIQGATKRHRALWFIEISFIVAIFRFYFHYSG